MIEIDVDLTQFIRRVKETEIALRTEIGATLTRSARGAVSDAKSSASFKDRTGELRARITNEWLGRRGDWVLVALKAPVAYASYVEFGTSPHEIWPKMDFGVSGPLLKGQSRRKKDDVGVGRGRALRWYVGNPAAGSAANAVFATHVNHPGSKPYPFMWPAAERVKELFIAAFPNQFRARMRGIWS